MRFLRNVERVWRKTDGGNGLVLHVQFDPNNNFKVVDSTVSKEARQFAQVNGGAPAPAAQAATPPAVAQVANTPATPQAQASSCDGKSGLAMVACVAQAAKALGK